jgi:hypothetical protein
MPVFMVYEGRHLTNPHRTLRVVAEDGTTFHVLKFETDAEAQAAASKYDGSLWEDRDEAIGIALDRANGIGA